MDKKEKKCKHIWEQEYCECPDCNEGKHIICNKCGEEKQ